MIPSLPTEAIFAELRRIQAISRTISKQLINILTAFDSRCNILVQANLSGFAKTSERDSGLFTFNQQVGLRVLTEHASVLIGGHQ